MFSRSTEKQPASAAAKAGTSNNNNDNDEEDNIGLTEKEAQQQIFSKGNENNFTNGSQNNTRNNWLRALFGSKRRRRRRSDSNDDNIDKNHEHDDNIEFVDDDENADNNNTEREPATTGRETRRVAAGTSAWPVLPSVLLSFQQAVRDANIPQLRSIFQQLPRRSDRKALCNELDRNGLAPLHYAARHHNVQLSSLLIQYGSIVNIRDENGQTPLHFAARHKPQPSIPTTSGCAEIINENFVAVLCDAGADVNARDYTYLSTPLHVAVLRSNVDVCADLLNERKISPDLGDKFQRTPLHLASAQQQAVVGLEIVRMLLRSRTDDGVVSSLTKLDNNQCLPLHLAAANGNWQIVQILLEAMRTRCLPNDDNKILEQRDSHGNTPLILAARGGHKSVVRCLLLQATDGTDDGAVAVSSPAVVVNAANLSGNTALHFAAARGDEEICRWLTECGANLDARNLQLQTPLHRAAALNRIICVEYLGTVNGGDKTERKKLLEAIDENCTTPLLLAARNGHATMVKLLLEKLSANIFAVSKNDRNLLHLAAARNHARVIATALELGTTCTGENVRNLIMRRDRFGFYPLHLACKKGMLAAVRALIDKGYAKVDVRLENEQTALHLAARAGYADVIDALTDVDYELVNYEDENSETALHLAAHAGHYDAVAKLIRCGANVLVRNNVLHTALDKAASRGHTRICELLLKYDSSVGSGTGDKTSQQETSACTGCTTALHLACAGGHVDTARLLIEQGHASFAARDERGRNCLDLAIEHAQEDVAMYIAQSDQWLDAMRNDRWQRSSKRQTPMRQLVRLMPKVAYAVLTRCLSASGRPDEVGYKVACNYEFLEDTFAKKSLSPTANANKRKLQPYTHDTRVLKNNHPLMVMVRYEREELLMHPLTSSLIHSKWTLYGRTVFLTAFFFYCLYLALLTGYTLASAPVNRLFFVKTLSEENQLFAPFWMADMGCAPNTRWPLSADITRLHDAEVCTAIAQFRTPPYNCSMHALDAHAANQHFIIFFHIGQFVLLVGSVFFLLKSLVAWYALGTFDYIISSCVYLITIAMTIPWEGFNCFHDYGLKSAWKWQLASFNIFLAYVHYVLLLCYFPWIGLYVQMLKDVTQTLLRVFLVFFGIMLAFALSFHCAFKASVRHDQHLARIDNSDGYDHSAGWELNPFYTLPQALVKTFAMLIGEFDQETHFLRTNLHVTIVVFTLIVLVGSIALANLLVGLAVSDIKSVQDQATLRRVSMRINYVLSVERLMPWRLRRRYLMTPTRSVLYPNDERDNRKYFVEGEIINVIKRAFHGLVGASTMNENLAKRVVEALQRNKVEVAKLEKTFFTASSDQNSATPCSVCTENKNYVRRILDKVVERSTKLSDDDELEEKEEEQEKISPAKQLQAFVQMQTEILRSLNEMKKNFQGT